MNNDEELLSSEFISEVEDSEGVENPASSDEVPIDTLDESEEIIEETTEVTEETTEVTEETTEVMEETTGVTEETTEVTEETTEVIYQVVDLTKVENSLGIITCFVIFFSVYFLGAMVYKLVKDIFY